MVYFMENPHKMDDLGAKNPYFWVQHPYFNQPSTISSLKVGTFNKPLVFPFRYFLDVFRVLHGDVPVADQW